MQRKATDVKVEPRLLVWARETAGKSIDEVARRLKVSQETVRQWEAGREKPNIGHLEKLAESVYKRPLAVFFLPEPPEESPLPRDFRILPSGTAPTMSSNTRLAIRQAQRIRRLTRDISRDLGDETRASLRAIRLTDDPETLASEIRSTLGISDSIQSAWRDENEALRAWVKGVERRGVPVLQMSFSIEDARGFSLTGDGVPTIVLNRRDSTRGKIFSLLHEYGHLLLRDGGICRIDEKAYRRPEERVERFCNRLAAEILVPKDLLLRHDLVVSGSDLDSWREDTLAKLANHFKVSKEVILRRLLTYQLATQRFYDEKRDEWKKKVAKPFGRRNLPRECIQEKGAPFVSLVLEARQRDRITYSDVADFLGIRLKHLPAIERILSEGA